MQDVVIRPALLADRDALGALKLRAAMAYGDQAEALAAMPEAGQLAAELIEHTLVAQAPGAAVGFVTVVTTGSVAEIEELFVDPSAWGSGHGRRLLDEARRRALSQGAAVLRVVANSRALAFYARCGFEVVGEVMTELEPAPVMERPIRPD